MWPHRWQQPGSPIPGILQARTLVWVAISFSNAGKWKVKVKSLSCVWLCATPWTAAYQAPPSMGFSRQEYWSGVPYNTSSRFKWECAYKGPIQCLVCSECYRSGHYYYLTIHIPMEGRFHLRSLSHNQRKIWANTASPNGCCREEFTHRMGGLWCC